MITISTLPLRSPKRSPGGEKRKRRVLVPLLVLAVSLLVGCASADLVIRNDPAPAPIDMGFHNILFSTSCGPEYSMGQAGCSFGHSESLTGATFSVISPLGGSVSVYSRECGYESRRLLKQGEAVTYKVAEMVPPGAEFCRFTVFSAWEKPPKIKTEVPVRGQSGEFFVRIRPEGAEPAYLSWTPVQGFHNAGTGILYSQFREIATALDEPILLTVKTTEPVEDGKYQLYNYSLGIGIKEASFSGSEIAIPRDAILGTGKKGGYTLAGWAIGDGLDNDIAIAVNIFDVKNLQLAAEIELTEKEVCFDSESAVSLVAISSVDKASNDPSDCFPRPSAKAIIGFFTNVGRAAYAVIEGDSVKWIR